MIINELPVWIAIIMLSFNTQIDVTSGEKRYGDFDITIYGENNEVEIIETRQDGYTLQVLKYDQLFMAVDTTVSPPDTTYHANLLDENGDMDIRVITNKLRSSIIHYKTGNITDYVNE